MIEKEIPKSLSILWFIFIVIFVFLLSWGIVKISEI